MVGSSRSLVDAVGTCFNIDDEDAQIEQVSFASDDLCIGICIKKNLATKKVVFSVVN